MLKKEIKTFFKEIKDGNLEIVKHLVKNNNEFLSVCNFAPPKQDDGQSGLQMAFKTGNFAIAEFLINAGADVNFKEVSTVNDWTAPVLHDSIRAVIFNSYTLQKNTAEFDKAFALLQLLLDKKADPNAVDSYGNNCLLRAIMDSRQMINNPRADLSDGILLQQLRQVFKVLITAGADVTMGNEKRPDAVSFIAERGMKEYLLF